ncbi:hypothetical protein D3C72_1249790 [compost metagenome]
MSRRVRFEIGKLTLDPHHTNLAFKQLLNVNIELLNRVNSWFVGFRIDRGKIIQASLGRNIRFTKRLIWRV